MKLVYGVKNIHCRVILFFKNIYFLEVKFNMHDSVDSSELFKTLPEIYGALNFVNYVSSCLQCL